MSDKILSGHYDNKPRNLVYPGKRPSITDAIYEQKLSDYLEEGKKNHKRFKELEFNFKVDAIKDVGLENIPNVEEIFKYAQENNYDQGFHAQYVYLKELANLVLGAMK